LTALFSNPTLEDLFLRDVLKRCSGFDALSDESLQLIVTLLSHNTRMMTPRHDEFMDGWAEYSYDAVFDAAWRLAETVDPSSSWATALARLYPSLEARAFSIDDPLSLADRWVTDTGDAEATEKGRQQNARGWLSDRQSVRMGLGRLAIGRQPTRLYEVLASDDLALRCSAYACGTLTPEQVTVGYDRDGEIVFNQALDNHYLWQSVHTRQVLEGIAWAVGNKTSDLWPPNMFEGYRENMRRKHPEWFRDDDEDAPPESDVGAQPASKADVRALAKRIGQPALIPEQFGQALTTLNRRVGWIWWLALGALLATLVRR
jgi:hypothetical protein